MHQNKISSGHSDGALPRLTSVNDNHERPQQIEAAMGPITSTPVAEPFVRRIWAPAIIVIALGLTAAWVGLLGYGLVRLIAVAF
jgi:hypothetical protein